jgi:putative component of membrane protein insertase Oxa1/YidC/SpoIIIJ protein YidD
VNGWAVLVLAVAPSFGPFGSDRHPVTHDAVSETRRADAPHSAGFLDFSYEFYRRVVSPIDGPRCSHRPTCSRYGLLAVRQHGAVGLLLTIDRLLRGDSSSSLRLLRTFTDAGGTHFLDPVEESTFWFSRSP